jgi:mRNA degradation ribonuclease J1/J2
MTATLTFYGAVGEIGGNKILLKTNDGTILLDFGRRMNEYGRFFSDYIQARSKNALLDMLRLGVLPKIDCDYDVDEKSSRSSKRRHVSGHASKPELKLLIERINPEKIIPIHSEKPELFGEIFKGAIELPKNSQAIEI